MKSATVTASSKPARRKNGQIRLKALIDATDSLLSEYEVGEISLYQISERAGVPTASIYHFFPNKEAALIELAGVYFGKIIESGRRPIEPPPATWQELVAYRLRSAMEFYNSNPSSMKLFLGATINAEVRRRDMASIVQIAEARAQLMDRYFEMPHVPDWIAKISNSVALNDGIWALAYSQYRCVTMEALEEGTRATTAYLRCFLPEFIARRQVPEQAES